MARSLLTRMFHFRTAGLLHHAASDGDVVVVRALERASRKIKNEFAHRNSSPTPALATALDVAACAHARVFMCAWRGATLIRKANRLTKVATDAGNDTVVTLFRQWTLFEGDSEDDPDPEDDVAGTMSRKWRQA